MASCVSQCTRRCTCLCAAHVLFPPFPRSSPPYCNHHPMPLFARSWDCEPLPVCLQDLCYQEPSWGSFGGRALPPEGLLRDVTGDSKDITCCLDVFMTQQRFGILVGGEQGELEESVPKDKRARDEALI